MTIVSDFLGLAMTFFRFAIVGCIGFLIDVSAFLCLSLFFSPVVARALAFWLAVTSNWFCNRYFTFHCAREKAAVLQWGQFQLSALLGFIPNWGCYWWLLQHADWAVQKPVLALIPGVVAAMCVNYSLSRYWVFSAKRGE